MSKIAKNDLQKSLAKLKDMAKAQLHHTASDSDPGTWAGTSQDPQDEHASGIDANGTDYSGVRKSLAAKVRKSLALTPAEVAIAEGRNPLQYIAAKLAKSEKLTPAEQWAFKGGFDADKNMYKGTAAPTESVGTPGEADDANSVPETHVGGATDGDVEPDAKKSLAGAIAASEDLSKGFEISPFLADFAGAIATALEGMEARVIKSLQAAQGSLKSDVTKSQAAQDEFNKSLASAVVGMAQLLQGQQESVVAAASAPVGAPKSHLRAIQGGDVNKSGAVGPGGMGQDLTKSQIVDVMCDLVKSNKLPAGEVVKFESTGQMADGVRQLVQQHLAGGR